MRETITQQPLRLSISKDTKPDIRCHDGQDLAVAIAVHLGPLPDAIFASIFPIRISRPRCNDDVRRYSEVFR